MKNIGIASVENNLKYKIALALTQQSQGRESAPSPHSLTFYPRLRHRPHLKAWFWFTAWQTSYYGTAPVELAGNMSSKMLRKLLTWQCLTEALCYKNTYESMPREILVAMNHKTGWWRSHLCHQFRTRKKIIFSYNICPTPSTAKA